MHPSTISCCCALALASLSLPGQDRADPTTVVGRTTSLRAEAAAVVGEGAAFRAEFTAGGVTFVPALGERAPRNFPLALRLASIGRERGGPAPLAAAEPVIRDGAVVYARGAATERWDVLPEGVALSLCFDEPLAGDGDLVVRYRCDTELHGEPAADGGWRFVLPDVGAIAIGGVTGIAADGARAAGTLRCRDGELELVLPAAFVATARHPLVLDPLVGTELYFSGGTFPDSEPSAAYGDTMDRWLVVWRRVFSATDSRIRGQFVSGAGAPLGGLLTLDGSTAGLRRHPTVGNVWFSNRFLVAWQNAASPLGPYWIEYSAVSPATPGVSGVATLTSAASREEPVLASANGSETHVVLAFTERGTGIRAVRILVPATNNPAPVAEATIAADVTAHGPALSRSHHSSLGHVVTWIRGATNGEVRARRITNTLASSGSELVVRSASGGRAIGAVDVDGDFDQFVVGFDETESGTGGHHRDVWTQRVVEVIGNIALDGPARLVAGTPNDDARDPTVASLGNKFAIAWVDESGQDTAIAGTDLARDCTACGTPWSLQLLGWYGAHPRFGTRRAGGRLLVDDGLIVCAAPTGQLPGTGSITARRYAAYLGTDQIVTAGPGCGNAGTMAVLGGPFAVGNPDFRFQLAGAPPAALAFVNLGFPGNELVCGVCTFTNGVAIEYVPTVGSTSTYRLPLPCNPIFVGAVLSAQWVVFGTPPAPCPLAPGLSATDRLHLTFGS